jgi:hypothetical protein
MAVPAAVAAQSPTAPPHPTMPWGGITIPQGQMLRFVWVPPRPVVLQYLVQGPAPIAVEATPPAEGEAKPEGRPEETPADAPREPAVPSPQVVSQQVMIPGFYVRETTVGYHYPERWTIEQAGLNVYRWRMLPAQFISK